MRKKDFQKINDWLWEYKESEGGIPARLYASEKLLEETEEKALEQLIDMTKLPGIVSYALAMPDIHSGYGPPIGGVGAIEEEKGVISPSFIGFDQNCGVRILTSEIKREEAQKEMERLAKELYREVPSGLGKGGSLKLNVEELKKVLEGGAPYLVSLDRGEERDIENCEEEGKMKEARSEAVSGKAKERGRGQLGTLGSGNHFLEVQEVKRIFSKEKAEKMGLFEGQVVVMVHTGSRGLGHQNCSDHLKEAKDSMEKYNMPFINKDLTYFPYHSEEGGRFFSAMAAACNYAWANRQMITFRARRAWRKVFGKREKLSLLYDVAHNIAKKEVHKVSEKEEEFIVHRKGATRAFPEQPVIIPGSMGTSSYILIGKESGHASFYSASHGAGRRLSRNAAKKNISGKETVKGLQKRGINIKCGSLAGISEEAPEAYKDIEEIVNVVYNAGLADKFAELRPLAVIKGE